MAAWGGWLVRALLVGVCCWHVVRARDRVDFFALGGVLVLEPNPTPAVPITSVLWKHDGDLLAEWVQDEVPLTYYGSYKGRTDLDYSTGRLRLSNMNQTDNGTYTVEINSKLQDEVYTPKVAQKLSTKPQIRPEPVRCGPTMDKCILVCDGAEPENGPVTYTWSRDGRDQWEETPGEDLLIVKTQIRHVTKFACRMKNLANQLESDPYDNPLFEKDPPFNWLRLVLGLLGFGAVAGVAGLAFWKRDAIKARFGTNRTDAAPAAADSGTPKTEAVPLKEGAADGGPA